MYEFAVLVKLAVTFVAAVIVAVAGDQLENVVVYPVDSVTVAVTSLPSLKVNVVPLVVYLVLLFGTSNVLADTLP